jgi:lysophospholipase L1-like esterase
MRYLLLALLASLLLASPAAAHDRFVVGALGDSVAAGFGLDTDVGDNIACALHMPTSGCDSPRSSYPGVFARRIGADELANRAVSGTRPADWLGRRLDGVVAAHPDVVLVSVGANDLLSNKLCAALQACARRRLRLEHTRENVHRLLVRLDRRTHAIVLLVLYYRPSIDLANSVAEVNRALVGAAAGMNDVVVVHPPSFGEHGCGPFVDDPWMLGFTRDGCTHPNRAGHRAIAGAALAAFRRARARD